MAYYTIVKTIKENKVQQDKLTTDVFDYIFLGKGNPTELAEKSGLNVKTIGQMRTEFTYFYPLDSRHSGRDLVPNHLTFMIFNHTAVFPEKNWPRQIAINGSVMMEGAKMSKSFGNIIPLREGLAKFGADPVRLSVLSTAELMQDADFSPTIAKSMRDRLERLYRFASKLAKTHSKETPQTSFTAIDRWMLSRLNQHIKNATEAMDKLAVRKAIHTVLYELDQDFQWYLRRTANRKEKRKRKAAIAQVSKEVLDAQVRMLAPIAPHVCEEMWEMLGKEDFIARSPWPTNDESKIDVKAEENEGLITNVLEDTLNILKATRARPKKIHYYVAAPWKWKTYMKVLEGSVSAKILQKDLMKQLMQEPDLRAKAEKVAKFTGQIVDDITRTSEETKEKQMQIGLLNELEALEEARSFFQRELRAEIHIYNEEDPKRCDPKQRAQLAKPYRPAIYIE
jgi:leucyl-tRNA synthetase